MKSKFLKISAVITAFAVATASAVFYAPGSRLSADQDEDSPAGGCENHNESTAWTESAFSEEGKYFLNESIELKSEIKIEKNITICLNGQTITVAEGQRAFHIMGSGSLTICDCDGEGTIKSNEGSNDDDSDSDTNNGNDADGDNSTDIGNEDDNSNETSSDTDNNKIEDGGAVYVEKDGTFTFAGGTISGFSVERNGGGVYNGGTFEMTGGVISDNTSEKGGGVYVAQEGKGFKMTGGKICNNTVTHQGGGVFVDKKTDNKTGGFFEMNGGKILGNNIEYVEIYDKNFGGGGVYTAGEFIMNSGIISDNEAISSSEKVDHFYGGGVCITTQNGVFTMNNDSVISSNTGDYGGGVYVDYGTFEMNNGKINGENNGVKGGGGVGMGASGTFTMNNGEISGNISSKGGGVYAQGNFTMNGGAIGTKVDPNNATSDGGGVYLTDEKSNFTMNNGSISDNSSQNGGGVFLHKGNFTMTGGSVLDNKAYGFGCSVYMDRNTSEDKYNEGGEMLLNGNVIIQTTEKGAEGLKSNVYLKTGKVITIGEKFSISEDKIGIHPEEDPNCKDFIPVTKYGDDADYETFENMLEVNFSEDRDKQHIIYNDDRVELEGEHVFEEDNWEKTTEEHWHICTVCKTEIDKDKHKCDKPEWWVQDPENHWHICDDCKAEIDKEKHHYDDKDEWVWTDTQHWHECEDCERPIGRENHHFDDGKTTTETIVDGNGTTTNIHTTTYTCTDCGYSYTATEIDGMPAPPTVTDVTAPVVTTSSTSTSTGTSTPASEPTEPDNPVQPGESTPQSSEPTEPDDPVQPGESTPQSSEPTEPGDPVQPSEPTAQPSEPAAPGDPVQPNNPAETSNSEESNITEAGDSNNNAANNGDNATTTPNPSTGLAITLAPLGTAAVIAVITSKRKKK